MTVQEPNPDKIREPFVAYQYPGYDGNKFFLPFTSILEADTTSHPSPIFASPISGWAKSLMPRGGCKGEEGEFQASSEATECPDDETSHQIPMPHEIQTVWLDTTPLLSESAGPARNINLGHQLWLDLLLHRLRKAGKRKVADRIEYLTGEENAEDGGDIPAVPIVASFVKFYLDNPNWEQPLLGVTHNAELQAVWELSDQRRLVVEFQDKDIVRYVYRRSGGMRSSKFFIMGRQPRHKIRGILENTSV